MYTSCMIIIACNMVRHLKSSEGKYLLDRMKFCIPSFHAYGHNAACQVSLALSMACINCKYHNYCVYIGNV